MKMTKTLVLVAVLAASASFATSASAGEGYGWHEGEWNYWDHADSFCKEHGVKFSHGFFYPGKVQKHFTEKPTPPQVYNPDVTDEFSQLIVQTLAKKREDRPQDFHQVLMKLRTIRIFKSDAPIKKDEM